METQEKGGERGWDAKRARMVSLLRSRYGLRDDEVLRAMEEVPRHSCIPKAHRFMADAYGDHPCPIGYGQTISQPYIVAYMTAQMHVVRGERVLEIGTGSGYQAAILAELGAEVYSIEIVRELAAHARSALDAAGYRAVRVRTGNGYAGWAEYAPFDVIVVTCAPEEVPRALVDQLGEGGRMILPLGAHAQRLVTLRKRGGGVQREDDIMVRFVPMVHGENDETPKPE